MWINVWVAGKSVSQCDLSLTRANLSALEISHTHYKALYKCPVYFTYLLTWKNFDSIVIPFTISWVYCNLSVTTVTRYVHVYSSLSERKEEENHVGNWLTPGSPEKQTLSWFVCVCHLMYIVLLHLSCCLQCFDTVGWVSERASSL